MTACFLHDGRQQQGPFAIEEIRQRGLQPHEFIWCEGMADWQPVVEVEGLRPFIRPLSPPPGLHAMQERPEEASLAQPEVEEEDFVPSGSPKKAMDWKEGLGTVVFLILVGSLFYDFPFRLHFVIAPVEEAVEWVRQEIREMIQSQPFYPVLEYFFTWGGGLLLYFGLGFLSTVFSLFSKKTK